MSNVQTIIAEIKDTVAPLMDRWVEDRVAFLTDLKSKIYAVQDDEKFIASYEEARAYDKWLSKSTFKFQWFARMGVTKGDYQVAAYEGPKGIREKMEKEAAFKLKKVDVAVKKKINFDVDAVEKLYFTEGKDGFFEGAWKLNGEKTFSFDTFYAGGYNIQCLHVRTKYKLK